MVLFPEGGSLRIPAGGLKLSLDPGIQTSVTVELLQDVWPYWLDIGIDHAADAIATREQLKALKGSSDEQGTLLSLECRASMVAMGSAAFSLDSFYAAVRSHHDMPTLDERWKERRSRHARVSQTLAESFKLPNKAAKTIGDLVKELFKFRDWAVHPPSEFKSPVLHEVLRIGVSWWFVAFSAPNARQAVANAARVIHYCVQHPRTDSTDFVKWSEGARTLISKRIERVQREFGE